MQVVLNLEAEVARLREDYQSCQAVQQKILRGMDEINKKINTNQVQPRTDLASSIQTKSTFC